MKKLITVLILFLTCAILSAQSNLPNLIQASTMIVEGEVVEQSTFRFHENNLVYTKNKIRITKIFKGNPHKKYFYINTLGGLYEGRIHRWSHNFGFGESSHGMFFLSSASHPVNTNSQNTYELTEGKYGYLPYVKDIHQSNPTAYSYENYVIENIPKNLYGVIEQYTQMPKQKLSPNKFEQQLTFKNPTSETVCAEYIIENLEVIELNPLLGNPSYIIDFDINIRALQESFGLDKAEVIMEYSTDLLGTSVALNDNIQVALTSEVVSNSYQLVAFDAAPNKVGVTLQRTSGSIPLIISNNTTEIYHATIQVQNYSPNEILQLTVDENFDVSTCQISDGVVSNLLCNIYSEDVSGVISDFFAPAITALTPDTLAAGTRFINSLLTITGSNFGSMRGESGVEFTTLDSNGDIWTSPLDGDYVNWGDDNIQILVPSYGKIRGVPDNLVSFSTIQKPGSGQIRIKKVVVGVPQYSDTTSASYLDILYSVENDSEVNSDGMRTNQPQFLTNQNPNGSYTVRFSPEFKYDASGVNLRRVNDTNESYIEIAEQAIIEWQCRTGLNFVVDNTIEWNAVWGCQGNPNNPDQNLKNVIGFTLNPDMNPSSFELMNTSSVSYPDDGCNVSNPSVDIAPNFLRCATLRVIMEEFDDIDLLGNPTLLENTKLRLYNAILHELGHAHYLNHVRSNGELMKPNIILSGNANVTYYARQASRYIQDNSTNHNCQNGGYVLNNCFQTNSLEEVNKTPSDFFKVYSNPENIIIENLHLKHVNQIRAFDTVGRLLYSIPMNNNNNSISIPKIGYQGIFIITIKDSNNALYTFKISQL